MSLNNIQLPAIVLQNLYTKSLFDLKKPEQDPTLPAAEMISYLGNNKKNLVIIQASPDAIYLSDADLNFLLGILSACKLTMADIALINHSKNRPFTYTDVTGQFAAEKIFLFGITPELLGLPLQFPNYQVQQYNNQVYLSSVSLSELQNNKEEKTRLWNCLKKVFSIG